MNRFSITIVLIILTMVVALCTPDAIEVDTQLNDTQKEELQYRISRYAGRLAPKATWENREDAAFDEHYKQEAASLLPQFYHHDRKSDREYFLVTRIAPSIHEKYVALGGYYVLDENGTITDYEEVFRTWRHLKPDLMPRAEMLFRKMIKNEDLSAFYPEVTGDQYIEFPNSEVYYDKELRRWISTRENPLQEMYDEAAKTLKEAGDAIRESKGEEE